MLFRSQLQILNCSISLIHSNNANIWILLRIFFILRNNFLLKTIYCSFFCFIRSKSIHNELLDILRLIIQKSSTKFSSLIIRKMRSKLFNIFARKISLFSCTSIIFLTHIGDYGFRSSINISYRFIGLLRSRTNDNCRRIFKICYRIIRSCILINGSLLRLLEIFNIATSFSSLTGNILKIISAIHLYDLLSFIPRNIKIDQFICNFRSNY